MTHLFRIKKPVWPPAEGLRVFKNSPLYSLGPTVCSPNLVILGDAAYPLKSWLLVPYRDNGKLTPIQRNFNFVHAATRCTVERAFALLKGRFRRLKYLDMKHLEDVVQVVMTCCIFHNICLMNDTDVDLFVSRDDLDEPNTDALTRTDEVDEQCTNVRDEIAALLTNC